MSLNDTVNYLLFNNPISQLSISGISGILKMTGLKPKVQPAVTQAASQVMQSTLPLWRLAGRNMYFIRLAGLSGAAAVILGAYGAHRPFPENSEVDLRKIFETANRYHFFHTIALFGVPLSRSPILTGTLMVTGMALFCGPCYYRAFTGEQKLTKLTKLAPIGGVCLIVAWLTFIA